MALPNDRNTREYQSFTLDSLGQPALNIRVIAGGVGTLPGSLNDRWYQAFTLDGSGNPAFNAVLAGGSSGIITGSGTAGKLAKFTTASAIGDSIATESGSTITIAGTLNATNFNGIFGATTPAAGTFTTVIASTSVTSPLILGGTAVGSSLSLQSTSAAGTTDFVRILVGNAGATEALRVLDSGFTGVGTATPVTALQVSTVLTSSPRGIMSAQYNTGTDGARLHMRKARGTEGTPVIIVTGDNLGRLVASGYDGANYLEMASIIFTTEGTIALTRIPTNITFQTATNATPSVLTTAMSIDSTQSISLVGNLTRSGTFTFNPGFTLKANDTLGVASGGAINFAAVQNTTLTFSNNAGAHNSAASVSFALFTGGDASNNSSAKTWAQIHLNPTLNHGGSSANTVNTILAIAPILTSITGTTVYLADFGTTSSSYFSGFTSKYRIQTDGSTTQPGVLFAALGTPVAGTMVYCTNCDTPAAGIMATCTSAGGQTGAWAFRTNATPAWGCIGI